MLPEPVADPASTLKGCHDPTEVCARRAVTSHPDYRDVRNALKEWIFPPSFVRVTVGPGPRSSLHSIGIGYVFDLDRVPGLAALPGRAGIELFEWRQHVRGPDPLASMGTDPNLGPDPDACIDDCRRSRGVGYGIRFEQFTTNLFGVFASTKIYKPPCSEFWVTFGPMIEVPLFNKANVTLHAGLAFRAVASPRFEMRVSVGVWKRRTTEIGLRARKG